MRSATADATNVLTTGARAWKVDIEMAGPIQTPKMMLGFVVRQCAVALGHLPSAAELADWANNQRDGLGRYRIFGRAISIDDARVIMRNPGRLVSVREMGPGRRSL